MLHHHKTAAIFLARMLLCICLPTQFFCDVITDVSNISRFICFIFYISDILVFPNLNKTLNFFHYLNSNIVPFFCIKLSTQRLFSVSILSFFKLFKNILLRNIFQNLLCKLILDLWHQPRFMSFT